VTSCDRQNRRVDHPNSIDFDLDGGVIVSYRSLSAIVKP
jgi:hypothetical protein